MLSMDSGLNPFAPLNINGDCKAKLVDVNLIIYGGCPISIGDLTLFIL